MSESAGLPIDGLAAVTAPAVPALHPPEVLALLGQCISHLHDIVLITEAEPFDLPGPRIVFVNEAFERDTGYSTSEVIGATPRILQGPQTDAAELRRIGAGLRHWEVVRAELLNYKKNGETYWVEMEIVPVSDHTGRFTHWVSIQRDVTARKRAESLARLQEAQRTESLGTLAAGVAHDFNNIIAAILGNVAIAQHDIAEGADGLPALAQIGLAGLRARKLVQQILSYSRRQPQTFARESLATIVVEATDLLRAALPSGANLHVRVADAPLAVRADAVQIQQVLLNLGTNAWHALQGGPGTIEFDCRLAPDAASHGQANDLLAGAGANKEAAAAARSALIRVSDTGCGMDTATRERIFEPYFTTKPIGQGTGLGLSVAWGIVASHGATINVESEVGRGTRFELRFPLLDAEPQRVAEADSEDAPTAAVAKGHGARVLLVDDDEVVLSMLEGVLAKAGFQVASFSDPREALEAVRSAPDAFDVVVTDHNMPGLSGLQLAVQLKVIAPQLPVLIASGFVDAGLTESALQAGAAQVFQKEFAVEALSESVRRVLETRAEATR